MTNYTRDIYNDCDTKLYYPPVLQAHYNSLLSCNESVVCNYYYIHVLQRREREAHQCVGNYYIYYILYYARARYEYSLLIGALPRFRRTFACVDIIPNIRRQGRIVFLVYGGVYITQLFFRTAVYILLQLIANQLISNGEQVC